MRKALALVAACAFSAALPAAAHAHTLQQQHGGTTWSGQSWRVASGTNGAGQRNCPSHVHFGSSLTIQVSGGCGGGVTGSINRHMGSWSVSFHDTTGGGKYAIGLWPANGNRPEVDFAEDKPTDSARRLMTGTYHPKPGCTGCIHVMTTGNFTQQHTAAVHWTSGGFTLTLDGRTWARFPGGGYGGQLHLFIHNEAWGSGGSSTLTVSSVHVG